MSGYPGFLFGPNDNISRAMIAVILWRLEGSPVVSGEIQFDYVAEGAWYTEAIRWAAYAGVVTGYDYVSFGPNDPITREQMAAMLWRYAKYRGVDVSVGEDTNILFFTDAEAISEYAVSAMQWACGSHIINGYENGTLNPAGMASRAVAATIIMRYRENIVE